MFLGRAGRHEKTAQARASIHQHPGCKVRGDCSVALVILNTINMINILTIVVVNIFIVLLNLLILYLAGIVALVGSSVLTYILLYI